MSLLGQGREQAVKPVRDRVYNADWTYGPAGGITASEFGDIKEGDYDRETGRKRCSFCRVAKPLQEDGCCDSYCSKNQFAGVPHGRPYAWDKERVGREWLTLA